MLLGRARALARLLAPLARSLARSLALSLWVAKATDLNCEVTWAMSIARYMEALYAHRPNVAIQITDEYGKEPPNRSKNVIHDIPVFLGALP